MVRLSLAHLALTVSAFTVVQVCAFHQSTWQRYNLPYSTTTAKTTTACQLTESTDASGSSSSSSRRDFLGVSLFGIPAAVALTATTASTGGILLGAPPPAHAVGPVKINLLQPVYTASPCPKDRPIPGEKAMKGMRGLCVTVNADLEESPGKDLDKVGVYGFVTGKESGESVLANNPDLSTDAGQFAMIEEIKTTDKKIQFEFIAAIPQEVDITPYENGIIPLNFASLRVISFPGGQQYGAISPCEMNEFSDECEVWETENGKYEKADYMIKSNPRTKGR